MTQAVCLNCGAIKFGAFIPCPQCGHYPQSDEDKAKHLILTDWYFPIEQLEVFSRKVIAGDPLVFDEKTLAMFVTYVHTGKFPKGDLPPHE